MSDSIEVYFQKLENVLNRLLDRMDEFVDLLMRGREDWHRFQEFHAKTTGQTETMAVPSFEEEFARRYGGMKDAATEVGRLVMPVAHVLPGYHEGHQFQHAGISATDCTSWLTRRASTLLRDYYYCRKDIDNPTSIEEAIARDGLPEEYDRQWVADTLRLEFQAATEACHSRSRVPTDCEKRPVTDSSDEVVGYLGLRVDEARCEIRRDGFEEITVSFAKGSAEWHTFLVAYNARENGATGTQWKKGYPATWEARAKTKARVNEKLYSLHVTLEEQNPPKLVALNIS